MSMNNEFGMLKEGGGGRDPLGPTDYATGMIRWMKESTGDVSQPYLLEFFCRFDQIKQNSTRTSNVVFVELVRTLII